MPSARYVVAVGASAGGVEALTTMAAGLPPTLDAAVLVVLHVPADGRSRLASILSHAGPLPAAVSVDGEDLAPGRIYLSPRDSHLLIHGGAVRLSVGAKENGHRPAVDPLFRSAARWYGPRAVGVVLSGALDDGAAGAAAIAQQRGSVLVQDPAEALFDSMPRSARAAVPGAPVLRARDLGAVIPDLLARRADEPIPDVSRDLELETDMAEMDDGAVSGIEAPGELVSLSCPACHGSMTRVRTGAAITFRCHVGHAYGPLSLIEAQAQASEAALWTALASLEEQAAVHRDLGEHAETSEDRERHQEEAAEISTRARRLRLYLRAQPSLASTVSTSKATA